MASNGSAVLRIVNSNTWKIYNRKMSEWILIMGMHRELLPITCPRENQQEILAKSQSVRKKQGPQD